MQRREIMSAPAITIPARAGICEAATILVDAGFTALPVVDDDGALIGILSEADLLKDRISPDPRVHGRHIRPEHRGRPVTVAEVMTTRRDLLRAGVTRTDDDLLREIVRHLESLDDSGRWVVSVQAGVVEVEDLSSDPAEREAARRLAAAVPGVVSAAVRHRTPDPF